MKKSKDIGVLSKTIEVLEEKVKSLQIKESNYDATMHTKKVKDETDDKIKQIELQRKYNEINVEKGKVREEYAARFTDLATKEEFYKKRMHDLENREQQLLYLEDMKKDLDQQRSNFNKYKYDVGVQLEQANITIAEAAAIKEEIETDNIALAGREKRVAELEEEWNDRIGELEANEEKFRVEQENARVGMKEAMHA